MNFLNEVILAMIGYDSGEKELINHFMKVYGYASAIARSEGVDEKTQRIIDVASVLHDIGIPKAREVYGSGMGKYQEELGPAEAEALLVPLGMARDEIDRVKWLIAHHHTYTIEGIDHRILVEADFLVNLDEGHADEEKIRSVKENIFRTGTGLRILNCLFGV